MGSYRPGRLTTVVLPIGALQWVAHICGWGYAVSYGATKSVEESLDPAPVHGRVCFMELSRLRR